MSAALPFAGLDDVMWSYDVGCQWKKNIRKRAQGLPSQFKPLENVAFRFGVPKCHCPGHKISCQVDHSLNLLPGVGRTDGEGIERTWSGQNGAASSTKEMGAGSRADKLDDHFGHHNWLKTTAFGECNLGSCFVVTQLLFKELIFVSSGLWRPPRSESSARSTPTFLQASGPRTCRCGQMSSYNGRPTRRVAQTHIFLRSSHSRHTRQSSTFLLRTRRSLPQCVSVGPRGLRS